MSVSSASPIHRPAAIRLREWLTPPDRKSFEPLKKRRLAMSGTKPGLRKLTRCAAQLLPRRKRRASRCAKSQRRPACIGLASANLSARNNSFVEDPLLPLLRWRHDISGDPSRVNATSRLTTRSVYLLMADENPTGRGASIALDLPVEHVRFLRGVFEKARDGVGDELEEFPDQLDPKRLHREHAAYGRLLTALDELVIVPDHDVREVVGDLAEVIDQGNEHKRVVSEHEALHGLLAQLGEREGR